MSVDTTTKDVVNVSVAREIVVKVAVEYCVSVICWVIVDAGSVLTIVDGGSVLVIVDAGWVETKVVTKVDGGSVWVSVRVFVDAG